MLTFVNQQDMIDFGEKLASYLFPGAILTLEGDLGAGKTTFTKGIGKGLGIQKIINSFQVFFVVLQPFISPIVTIFKSDLSYIYQFH